MRLLHHTKALTGSRRKLIRRYLNFLIPQRRRKYDLLDILEAILFILRTGSQWDVLDDHPRFPPKAVTYYYFSTWSKEYIFDKLNAMLVKRLRAARRGRNRSHKNERHPARRRRNRQPTACVVDSQSIKSLVWGRRESHGFDGNKRINGVKYHAAVDTNGRVLACVTSGANKQDSKAFADLLDAVRRAGFTKIKVVYADAGYQGCEGIARGRGARLSIIKRTEYAEAKRLNVKVKGEKFVVLPKRWVVERTFSHRRWARRTCISHDRLDCVVEAWFLLASIHQILRLS